MAESLIKMVKDGYSVTIGQVDNSYFVLVRTSKLNYTRALIDSMYFDEEGLEATLSELRRKI